MAVVFFFLFHLRNMDRTESHYPSQKYGELIIGMNYTVIPPTH
jgi:hypothetical protein